MHLQRGSPDRAEALVAEPPATPEPRQERIAGILRGLLLVGLHDRGRAPDGRKEAWQLLARARQQLQHEPRMGEGHLLVDALAAPFAAA